MRNAKGITGAWLMAGVVCLCWTATPAVAGEALASSKQRFDVWRTEEGLPQSTISAILQTRDGYLWLGTYRGLVRFDGFVFKVFDTENTPELKSDHITCLFEDADLNLWIGTKSGGVTRHREGKFTPFTKADGLSDDDVSALGSDGAGTVWVGTARGGLNEFRDWEFVSYPILQEQRGTRSDPSVLSIVGDRNRNLWLATSESLSLVQGGELVRAFRDPSRTLCMSGARDGGLWVAAEGHLLKFNNDGSTNDFGAYLSSGDAVTVKALYEDRKGRVWIGTYGEGLIGFEQGKFTVLSAADGLVNNLILSVYEDMDGNLWIGTYGGGLYRMREPLFETYDRDRGMSVNVVVSVCESRDGGMWVGTDGGGLNRLQGERIELSSHRELRNRSITSVFEDTRHTVWIGTSGNGLFQLKGETLTNYVAGAGKTLGSQKIRAIYEDRKGAIWIGTEDAGLARIERDTLTQFDEHDGLSNLDVRAILEDRSGNLWVGTGGGGLHRLAGGRFQSFKAHGGLPSNYIRTLFEDKDGTLWIGTGGGLSRFKDGRFTGYNTRNGLADNVISQIFEDGRGNLWLGSFRGVFRVSKRDFERVAEGTLRRLTCVVYGKADGLNERECTGGVQPSGWQSRDGRLWFPTINGVAMVDPASVKMNPRPPPVVIENFEVDGESKGVGSSFTVHYGKERYAIYYTAFNFTSPRRLRFQYQLEGFDKDMVDAGPARKAVYGYIPPGTYRFHVIAANNDGVANEIGKSFELIILPPFWLRWWFLSGAGLLVVGAFGGTFRYLSFRKLQRKLQLLQRQHALDSERARIAKDMHDDLGARMTQIGLLSELIKRDIAKQQEARDLAAKLSEKSREVASTLDEIVWAVNPRNDTFDKLVAYLVHYAEEFFEVTSIRYRMEVPTDPPAFPLVAEIRHNLFLVYKEALNNVVKHARASEVQIRVFCTETAIELSIEDNGRGFDPRVVPPTSNGLLNMKRRLEDIGGRCDLESQPGKGTCVKLSFPRRQ